MEKLLELLNDYSPLKDMSDEYCVKYWKVWIRTRLYAEPDVYANYTLQVISKKFWFIQWLVDNDKIDKQWAKNLLYESEVFNSLPYTDLVERLIMYLAIQDDPIEFLISILK